MTGMNTQGIFKCHLSYSELATVFEALGCFSDLQWRATGEAPRQFYWARVHLMLHTPRLGSELHTYPCLLRRPITSCMQCVDQGGSKRLALNSSGRLRESRMGHSLHINPTGVHGRLQCKGEPRIILEGSTV
ncbi:unnamed protein product [Fusarium venenatum]|uniref:Uncharacterized protein n=1 Tax=Fusarium venenatum TaxID=56646 RepID=A0A2L2TF55_9HYPO|nr:uncharacterized protein FVRRES_11658 [Fusarium venenatum]CEI38967.1 unnamed protein product [Fusarium venenatum]